jgi:hypothetical protein
MLVLRPFLYLGASAPPCRWSEYLTRDICPRSAHLEKLHFSPRRASEDHLDSDRAFASCGLPRKSYDISPAGISISADALTGGPIGAATKIVPMRCLQGLVRTGARTSRQELGASILDEASRLHSLLWFVRGRSTCCFPTAGEPHVRDGATEASRLDNPISVELNPLSGPVSRLAALVRQQKWKL